VVAIGVLIDSPPTARFHHATIEALHHAGAATGRAIRVRSIPTDSADLDETVAACAGVVIGPGSPYRDEIAVWRTIAGARERGIPLVGT
jgi:CTP synthase (UTP-ammonia lyase)